MIYTSFNITYYDNSLLGEIFKRFCNAFGVLYIISTHACYDFRNDRFKFTLLQSIYINI